ncbi:MAG: hypothetical protein COB00_19420 [Alcanivorax sp.]|nr:MAG: hypothetical protein COB00_19420 [Alcanivorax sp.]
MHLLRTSSRVSTSPADFGLLITANAPCLRAALSWRETFERLAYQQDTSPSIGALRALRRQRRRLMKACR